MMLSGWFDKRYVVRIAKLIVLFLLMRAFLGVWMWGVRQIVPVQITNPSILSLYGTTLPEANPWLEPWQRWDTPQYQAIARDGYEAFDTALFTPPLYPLLMYLVSSFTFGNTLASGLLVSGFAAILSILAMERISSLMPMDEKDSFRSAIYLMFFPTAFFLSAAYSESIYLVAAILSLYYAQYQKWIPAGIWGGIAGLSRTPGFFIVIPLAYSAWIAWKSGDKKGWLSILISGGLILLFPLYVMIGLGQWPTAIFEALRQRGGYLTLPGLNLLEALVRIFNGQLVEENLIEATFTIFMVIMAVHIWKKLPRIYFVYTFTLMLLFLTRMGYPQPLVGMARYVLEIFPIFMVLAIWGRNPWANRIILYTSLLLQLFLAGQFALWGWVG